MELGGLPLPGAGCFRCFGSTSALAAAERGLQPPAQGLAPSLYRGRCDNTEVCAAGRITVPWGYWGFCCKETAIA